jgi:hypothetical protein
VQCVLIGNKCDCKNVPVSDEAGTLPVFLDALRVTYSFIIINICIVRCVSASFTFENNILDGLMLDKAGVVSGSCIEQNQCMW